MKGSMMRGAAAWVSILLAITIRDGAASEPMSDTSAVATAAGAVPSAQDLQRIRVRVENQGVDVLDGENHLRLRHVVVDSAGMSFKSRQQDYAAFVYHEWGLDTLGERRTASAGPGTMLVPWSRIDRIEVRRSHAWLGAGVGLGIGSFAAARQLSSPSIGDEGIGLLFLVPAEIVLSTLAGSAIGAMSQGRSVVWQRRRD